MDAAKKMQNGFTILEVLISMVILAVGLLALSSMQGTFATGNAQSRELIHATNMASSKLEDLKAADYNATALKDNYENGLDEVGGSSDHNNTVSRDGREYTIHWNVEDNETFHFKQIRVIVIWKEGDKKFSLDWIKSKNL